MISYYFRYKDGFRLHRIIQIGLPAGENQVFSITTKGDALIHTETITSEDVIAVASLPKRTLFQRIYRRIVFIGIKIKNKLSHISPRILIHSIQEGS